MAANRAPVESELDDVADALVKAIEEEVGDALFGGDIEEEDGDDDETVSAVAVDASCDCDCEVLVGVLCADDGAEETSLALAEEADDKDEAAVAEDDNVDEEAGLEALTTALAVFASPSLGANTVDT